MACLYQAGATAVLAAISETEWERGFAMLAHSAAQVCVPLVVEAHTMERAGALSRGQPCCSFI